MAPSSTHKYKVAAAVHRALNALYDLAVELADDPRFGEQAAHQLRDVANEIQYKYSPFEEENH